MDAGLIQTFGLGQQPPVHCRHAEEHGDRRVGVDGGENVAGVELAAQNHARASEERAVHANHQTVRMEERQRQQQTVIRRPAPRLGDGL